MTLINKPKKLMQRGALVLALVFTLTGTAFVGGASAATQCVYREFGVGNSGNCVKYIQTMTNNIEARHDYKGGKRLTVDGIYGPLTAGQVKLVQKWYMSWGDHDPISIDGIVGKDTWHVLCSYTYNNHQSKTVQAAGEAAGCASLGY